MEPLTTAELRAMHAVARFETASEAAKAAGLSPQTLRNQCYSAYQKLGVKGKVEAWRKMGWLRPPRFMPSADDAEPYGKPWEEERPDPVEEPAAAISALLAEKHQAPMIERFRREQEAKRAQT